MLEVLSGWGCQAMAQVLEPTWGFLQRHRRWEPTKTQACCRWVPNIKGVKGDPRISGHREEPPLELGDNSGELEGVQQHGPGLWLSSVTSALHAQVWPSPGGEKKFQFVGE